MTKKLFLAIICIANFFFFSNAEITNGNDTTNAMNLLTAFQTDSVHWFPSCNVYEEFFGAVPIVSFHIEPVLLTKGPVFVNLDLGHCMWYGGDGNFLQLMLNPGIKINRWFKIYGGMALKVSSDNYRFHQTNSYDLLGNMGVQIDFTKSFFIKLNYFKYSYDFTPDIYRCYIPFMYREYHHTPYFRFGFDIGYRIHQKMGKQKQFDSYSSTWNPKNEINISSGLQFPLLSAGYGRQLFKFGKYVFFLDLDYRQGKITDKHKIKNTQLTIDNRFFLTQDVWWNTSVVFDYYYVVDNNKPSIFDALEFQTGLSILLSDHFQLKYLITYPLYYFNIQPEVRSEYQIYFKSYPKISLAYRF